MAGSETRHTLSSILRCLSGDIMTHNTSHDETASELANSGECIDGDQFDWKTIRVLCVSGIPKHEAYGMNFEEYRNKREFVTDDTTEKKRLSFYIPAFPTMLNMDFAAMYNASIHRFTLLVLELGLIHFQHDYYGKYGSIKKLRGEAMLSKVASHEKRNVFMHLEGCTISLGACAGSKTKASKRSTVATPEWFYNALIDTAKHLNMSISDLVYLCWCIGVTKCVLNSRVNNVYLKKEFDDIIEHFEFELNYFLTNIKDTICKIDERE